MSQMRHLFAVGLLASLVGALLLSCPVFAQETGSDQVEENAPETDLGSSVDELLSNELGNSQDAQKAIVQPVRPVEVDKPLRRFESFDDIDADEDEPVEVSYDQFKHATLRALDKITGRSVDINVAADQPIVFGSLNIEMKTCYQTPPELPPEAAVFLTINSTQAVRVESMEKAVDARDVSTVNAGNPRLFSGWMFASSPGLSALEHPVYDVWVIRCNAA